MKRKLFWLIGISTVIRIIAATFTELGNDEVYYRILALFPDTSYFDHPPMVAWMVALTTAWKEVAHEFFVRLGPIIIGSINTWLVYILTRKAGGSEKAGFIASLLCTASIYMTIICGTFVMPDTPLTLFWLLSLIFLTDAFKTEKKSSILLFGICTGMAMLSKYTGGELWLGTVLYILIFNRKWLKNPYIYISALLSLIIFSPVILWNVQNDFISLAFHGDRITNGNKIELYLFFRELLGEFYYNNPINWIITLIAIIAYFKGKFSIDKHWLYLLLSISVPMIVLFLFISLTRETLPHWSAPAYMTLIPVSALYLDKKRKGEKWGYLGTGLIFFTLLIGIAQVNFGLVTFTDDRGYWRLGSSDFSLDMYGWKQGGEKFDSLQRADTLMSKNTPIIQYGWDDAAHIDCYFALPYGHKLMTMGEPGTIHYWDWITKRRGGFVPNEDVWLITSSRYPKEPEEFYKDDFNQIFPADTLKIIRNGEHVMNFYIYRLKGLRTDSKKAIFSDKQ